MFLAIISPKFLLLKRGEMSAIFVSTTKTTQPRPQVFSVNGCIFDVISTLNTKFLQILDYDQSLFFV